MANPPRQLAPPPDNTQILSFIRVEYARRVAPEDAYRNICVVFRYMREHPNEVLELARERQQQPAPAPEAPRSEEPKQDDSEKVEPEKESEPPRDHKRAKHSPINPSEAKKPKHEEHDPQEGTSSSQFRPPHPSTESAAPVPMDIEDLADISDPNIHAGDETMELVEAALQKPQINREEPKAQEEARKSEEPPSGDDDLSRSPPLAKELARAEDARRPDTPPEKPKTPEHDPQEGTSSQHQPPLESDVSGKEERPEDLSKSSQSDSGADESADQKDKVETEEVKIANMANREGAGYWQEALQRNQQRGRERQHDDDRDSSVDFEDYPDSDIDSDDYGVDELDDLDDTDVIPDKYIILFGEFSGNH